MPHVRSSAEADRKALVRSTFNAAAPHFDAAPLFFWETLGRRTVEIAGVQPGDRVLDLCCGTGASALPAARVAGPTGHVVGLDLAEGLLLRAQTKAAEEGLAGLSFVRGDLERPPVADASVDVVACVLGLYFARDLPSTVARLWRLLRPGGTLAITTWGTRSLEPAHSVYLGAVAQVCPGMDVRGAALSWSRINTAARIRQVFAEAGVRRPTVWQETVVHPTTASDCWTVVLGSGYRIWLDLMGAEAAARVHDICLRRLRSQRVTSLTADVLYARARKQADPSP
jgi:ubiquinone/menaquinone biosynthesis C-methylase UbiE